MPYRKISDLPASQVDQYDQHQRKAFLEAFNNAEREYGDEHKAFAVAHHAAKQAAKKRRSDDPEQPQWRGPSAGAHHRSNDASAPIDHTGPARCNLIACTHLPPPATARRHPRT